MRVAVQFSGKPRSFKRCYESFLKNIKSTLNPDVFVHTWQSNGVDERSDVLTDGTPEEYVELYKPDSYQIELSNYTYKPMQTMVPHFTSRFRVNELRNKFEKENNIKYDVVISARSDVKLINSIPNNNSKVLGSEFKIDYLKDFKEDDIWIHHFKSGIPADYFFYTSSKWMDITTKGCYNNLDKLDIYQPGSERLWWYILQQNGFEREWFKYFGNSIHDEDHIKNSFKFFDIECIR